MEWWDGGEILGGRDELAGGTWLACSRDGRVAFLTNVREVKCLPDAKSRGDLPSRFLQVTHFAFVKSKEKNVEIDVESGSNERTTKMENARITWIGLMG